MKIGLLTYYGDLNCGTNLQAYAALLALRKVFPNDAAEVIPFHGFTPPGKHPYLHHCTISSLCKDFKRILKYNQFVKDSLGVKHDVIIKNVGKALSYIREKQYDRIYIGADTLLELDRIPNENILSAYWLSPAIKAKKYFLAASAKNTICEDLSDSQKRLMQETLSDFSGYGVRDINTAKLIRNFVESFKVELVPDPTFSLEIDNKYVDNYLKNKRLSISKKSLLFHTNKEDTWAKDVALSFKKLGFKIYSLRPYPWADVILNDMSPLEQLGIYHYFECVITHRFHDAIFCLKNKTPLFLYSPQGFGTGVNGSSKFIDLMENFGLRDICFVANPSVDVVNRLGEMRQIFKSKIPYIEKQLMEYQNIFINYISDGK